MKGFKMTTGGRIPAAKRPPILANLGIHLKSEDGLYVVTPRMPDGGLAPVEQRFPMPRLPSPLLEDSCGMVRAFWRCHHRCVGVLFYLDIDAGTWNAFVPSQTVAPNDFQARCDFQGLRGPGIRSRLAGSIRSWPATTGLAPELFVLPHDGIHILVDPLKAWISIIGFLHVAGELVPTPVDQMIADEHDALIKTLGTRFQFVDAL